MKILLRFLLIAGLSYLGLQYFSWWIIAVVAFLVGLILSEKKPRRLFDKRVPPTLSFLMGFLAIVLVWGGMAYWIDQQNASLLSQKIFDLLFGSIMSPESQSNVSAPWAMIGLTAIVGGLLGGFSALTGNLLGEAIKN